MTPNSAIVLMAKSLSASRSARGEDKYTTNSRRISIEIKDTLTKKKEWREIYHSFLVSGQVTCSVR
jgi:hypothetical protein